ncbi:SNARE associated Golgi protein family [Actinidia rufa]|uniref:SNARE associated Golgi protein family n=1 Tax=Actinidia rufa TaxID=165716 RepID=A0A7J0HD23_9ERIC|nr:SNARE associated Golgi protein family [Actinidia rufa]
MGNESRWSPRFGRWAAVAAMVAIIGVLARGLGGWDKETAVEWLRKMSDRLGIWAIPAYVGLHTVTLALCLPYAVFFEAGASILFGFFPAVLCVFSAKLLGASLSFWIGRIVFRSSSTAMGWAQRNKYFNMLSKGVEQDGWKFVLLARFSPIPSYVINYALAATRVAFVVDFLLPTVIGGLPMILQNTSIGSLAGAAVASASGAKKSQVWSYLFPLLGILSSILISLRVKKYASNISVSVSCPSEDTSDCNNNVDSSTSSSTGKGIKGPKEKQ